MPPLRPRVVAAREPAAEGLPEPQVQVPVLGSAAAAEDDDEIGSELVGFHFNTRAHGGARTHNPSQGGGLVNRCVCQFHHVRATGLREAWPVNRASRRPSPLRSMALEWSASSGPEIHRVWTNYTREVSRQSLRVLALGFQEPSRLEHDLDHMGCQNCGADGGSRWSTSPRIVATGSQQVRH